MNEAIQELRLTRRHAGLWQGLLQRLVAWYQMRATRHALDRLDDRMLKDIGVERCEIASRIVYLARDAEGRGRR